MFDELPFSHIDILNRILMSFWSEYGDLICFDCYDVLKCGISRSYDGHYDGHLECTHMTLFEHHETSKRCGICETIYIVKHGPTLFGSEFFYLSVTCCSLC